MSYQLKKILIKTILKFIILFPYLFEKCIQVSAGETRSWLQYRGLVISIFTWLVNFESIVNLKSPLF